MDELAGLFSTNAPKQEAATGAVQDTSKMREGLDVRACLLEEMYKQCVWGLLQDSSFEFI